MSKFTGLTIVLLLSIGQAFSRTCTTTGVSYRTTSSVGYYSEPYSESYNCGFWDWSRCTRTRYRSRTTALYRQTAVYHTACCSGYSGSGCRAVCAPACQNGGTCSSPNVCSCRSGWTGSICNRPVCTFGCANGGTCTAPNSCSCRSGWTGLTCSQPVCSPNCENGGTCSSPNTCSCQSGWSGESCTNDVDECAVENGGCHHSCHNTAGSFECRCGSGYSLASDGKTCNEPPAVPLNVAVSNVGQTSATVSWESPPNTFPNSLTAVSTYKVWASQNQFQQGNRVITVGKQSRMHEFTNIEEYTTYSFSVAASNSFGEGVASDPIEATTLEAAPSASPLEVEVSSNSSYNITIQWTPPPAIDRNGVIVYYEIHVTETEMGKEFRWTSTELNTTLGSLHAYYHYDCRVAAHTAVGVGPFSTVEAIQTLPAAPTAAPTQVTVSTFDSSSISLVWEPPPFGDQNGAIIQYHIRVTELDTQTEFEFTSTSQRYTLTSLHPYYNYSISIAAETVAVGPFTPVIVQQTLESVPSSAPENFSMTVVNSTSLFLSWSELPLPDRNGVIQKYTIHLMNIKSRKHTDFDVIVGPHTITNLQPSYTYRGKVAAATVIGVGPFSSTIEVTLPEAAPSGCPLHFLVKQVLSRSMTLSWELPLERDRNGVISGFKINLIESPSNNITALDVENTTVTIEDVKPFTLYYAEVAAYTLAGIGPYTERISVLTEEDVPSPVRVILVRTVLGRPTQLSLQWSPPEEPNGELLAYSVYCRMSAKQPLCNCDPTIHMNLTSCLCAHFEVNLSYHQQAVLPVDVPHTLLVGGFSPYTNYTCFMTANTSAGESSPGTPYSAVTEESIPADNPQDMLVYQLNSTAIYVQWSPPLIPNGIIIFYTIYINNITLFNISTDQNSLQVGGFSPYQLLTVRLSASTKIGEGPLTESQNVTTLESVPGAVENVKVTVLSDDIFHVTWDPPLSPNGVLTGYHIMVTDLINSSEIFTNVILPSVQELNITSGIYSYVRYKVSVTASTHVGPGDPVEVILYTKQGVPQSSPPNMISTRSSATSASVEWDEMSWEDLRGWLVSYEIGYESVRSGQCPASDSTHNETESVNQEMFVVTGLDPGLQYCVWVAGRTSAGVGPFSYSLIPWYTNSIFTVTLKKLSCSKWMADQKEEIVEDLARDISKGIEQMCHCEFPSDYIAERQLLCHNTSLVFQGRIISTNNRESTDLLADLQKWLSTEPTLTAKGEDLHLVKNDTKPTDKVTEPAKQEDTSANGFPVTIVAPVGGVVFLVIILGVAIVTVMVCYRRRKVSSIAIGKTSNSMTDKPAGETDHYSYIGTRDFPQNDHSTETEKQQIELEYEIPVVEDENVYEDPDELMESTVEGPGICNPTYNIVPGEEDEGDEEIYSEIKD